MVALLIPIGIIALWYFAYGAALTSANTSQAHTTWYGWITGALLAVPVTFVKYSVELAKYVAHFMFPALKSAEHHVASFFAHYEIVQEWQANHAHRTAKATYNVAWWAKTKLKSQILARAHEDASATFTRDAFTKAPPVPQRRLTQHQVDVEFQRAIEGQFVTHLKNDFPKFDWDPDQWRKWLGVLPALGGAVVHPHPATPKVVPQPLPKPGTGPVPIGPPQPVTLPHTDDHPNPDPGTQLVPSVISGKDKWSRGQIVKLRKKQTSLLDHLGPLAFLALPIAGITTLIGLLECKNFKRFLNPFCAMPTNLLNDLLALITDFFILTDICEVITIVDDAFGEISGPLVSFTDDAVGALCHGKFPEHPWVKLAYSTAAPELNTLAL